MSADEPAVKQTFNAPVRNVAGRDIIQNHVSATNILRVLERAVRESQAIPEPQKVGLLDQIRSLASNPYVSGLATSAIYELLKTYVFPG